jgi:hypothetical protein
MLELRRVVLDRKKPRKIFVQPHTKIHGDHVQMEACPMLISFASLVGGLW